MRWARTQQQQQRRLEQGAMLWSLQMLESSLSRLLPRQCGALQSKLTLAVAPPSELDAPPHTGAPGSLLPSTS